MTNQTRKSDGQQAIEETFASFSCEGIVFTHEERQMIHQMEAEGLSTEERISRLKAYLTGSLPQP